MALIQDWYPPSKENYDLLLFVWYFFPLWASAQWGMTWYGMGKTSVDKSLLNIPGRIAWFTMECPGFLTLLYTMYTLPKEHGISSLPWQNQILAALYVVHYLYRAVLFPVLQPSMSPIHLFIWASAVVFQLVNATLIGSYLAAYGPTTRDAWAQRVPVLQFAVGFVLFYLGLMTNYYHDEQLREIRRREQERQERIATKQGVRPSSVHKHYQIPQAGLFKYMLYPHYLAEWVEWTGFYIAAGFGCMPALMFVVNEVTAMLPRAYNGKKWYVQKFGEEKIRGKWAVLPGVC